MYLGEGLIFCATQIDKLLEMVSKRRCSFDSQEEFDKGKDTGAGYNLESYMIFVEKKCKIIALLPN